MKWPAEHFTPAEFRVADAGRGKTHPEQVLALFDNAIGQCARDLSLSAGAVRAEIATADIDATTRTNHHEQR